MGCPKVCIEKVQWNGFDEYPVLRPYEMQLHVLSNCYVAAEQGLIVERSGWHWTTAYPEMFLNGIQALDKEFFFKELEGRLRGYDAVDFSAGCCWEEGLEVLCLVLRFG